MYLNRSKTTKLKLNDEIFELYFTFNIFTFLGVFYGTKYRIHSKKCWVVLTQFWVKYGQTRNVGLKM